MQLFLLHFAGGNCYSYDFLKKKLKAKDFSVYALELPGRGKRYNENLLLNKKEAIQDYVKQIKNLRNKEPYIIYGHSMGATLGFSVVREMEQEKDAPLQLIVTGNAGPGLKVFEENDTKIKKDRYTLPDPEFKTVLRELGGIPEEVLENQELFDFFSPIIRADFQVLETGGFIEQNTKIDCPIHAIMGDSEKRAHRIDNWKKYTTANFKSQILPGNHFFIHDHPEEIASILIKGANYGQLTI
ncbi:thioesterase II family protein [Flavobacterium poyangense]|uniref:thioesterase II family protein n=1 Tax=Flavobacterium poyangense TaxID=2204302 RepID=UPI001423337F|nr:alpha/beta fold hydrolase [Flavobacterium sp. JXAS1]